MTRLAEPVGVRAPANPVPARSASVRDWARAAAQDAAGTGETLVLSLPAPNVPPEALLHVGARRHLVLWDSPDERVFAGAGLTHELIGVGSLRFHQVRKQAETLWPRLRVAAWSVGTPPAPAFVGGFAFQAGDAAQAPWHAFGDAWFVLPRLRYDRLREQAWLSLAVRGDQLQTAGERGSAVDELLSARAELGRYDPRAPARGEALLHSREQESARSWSALVESISAGISAGQFEKVVAARRAVLELQPPPDPLAVLTRLRDEALGCIRFGFRRNGASFLGATPERLVAQFGREVRTEAMAGSIRANGRQAAHDLLHSEKNLAEHDFVLRELLRCLAPVCDSLESAEQPSVHALRHLLHLRSPVAARRREPGHVLQLVERLHPTPAVGGVPTDRALRWISEHEPDSRGWYAGPVGWFDARGDGEFAVALRSGVLEGGRAHLYAGAGIVRHSDAPSEYAETTLKLAALRAALGVIP